MWLALLWWGDCDRREPEISATSACHTPPRGFCAVLGAGLGVQDHCGPPLHCGEGTAWASVTSDKWAGAEEGHSLSRTKLRSGSSEHFPTRRWLWASASVFSLSDFSKIAAESVERQLPRLNLRPPSITDQSLHPPSSLEWGLSPGPVVSTKPVAGLLRSFCYGLNVWVPPKLMSDPQVQCDAVGGLWEVMRSWGCPPMNGISALKMSPPQRAPSPSPMWGHRRRGLWSRKGGLTRQHIVWFWFMGRTTCSQLQTLS